MKYLVCQKPGEFRLLEKEKPKPKEGQALLKVKKVGICGTDLHAYGGNQAYFEYPRILGHELVAEVLAIKENPQKIKVGDRVIVMPYMNCGHCIACRNGQTNCCSNMQVLGVHKDGGMQEVVAVNQELLLSVSELSINEAVIMEPLAIGAHALRRAQVKAGETIAVVGCGPIGIGISKLAQIDGVKVIALDVNEQRLQFAKEKLQVDHTVNVLEKPEEKIREYTKGDMATAVFDATGNRKALETGIDYMSHGGRYVLVGLSNGELTFNHPAIHRKETTLLCSRNATLEDFEKVKSALKSGLFPTDAFITHQVNFQEMIAHFDSWLEPKNGVIKALVEF